MKTAIYPGSFNPWHEGHTDVLHKALEVFDRVDVVIGVNPDKMSKSEFELESSLRRVKAIEEIALGGIDGIHNGDVVVHVISGFLKDYINNTHSAIIKGIRNTLDFEYEKIQQYNNEDLDIVIPVFYVIADRELVHVSSTAIRTINALKGKK